MKDARINALFNDVVGKQIRWWEDDDSTASEIRRLAKENSLDIVWPGEGATGMFDPRRVWINVDDQGGKFFVKDFDVH